MQLIKLSITRKIIRFTPTLQTKRIISTSLILLLFQLVGFAQPNLETAVPSNYSTVKGTLSISDRHYRLGTQSLRWDWQGGDTLIIDLNASEEKYVNDNLLVWGQNHFEVWAHNETPAQDTFEVKFINRHNEDQFRFRFNTNYNGWRRLLRSYRHDMLKRYVQYDAYRWNVDKIYLLAPVSGSGSIFLDNIQYMRTSENKQADRQMPDLFALASDQVYFSSDFYYRLDTLTATAPLRTPTAKELAELELIRDRIKKLGIAKAPSATELNKANDEYNSYNIDVSDNLIKGKDIATPAQIGDMFSVFCNSYAFDNNTESKQKAINLLRLMFDGGVAGGSGRWFAGGANGYGDMTFFKALIIASSFVDEGMKYQLWDWLNWSTAINQGWDENTDGKFNTDNTYVLQDAFLCTILLCPDDAYAVQDLQRLKLYIEKFLQVQKGNTDGMKPDGTGFHHAGHYNAYMYSYATLADPLLYTVRGTSFLINAEAYQNLRKMVYAQSIMCNNLQFANSLSGRHAFFTRITFSGGFFTRMAKVGGEILNAPIDTAIAGMRTRLYGTDLPPSGIPAEPFPTGFWQMNYSPLAMYRRNNWAATIKGINNYFWGTEISSDGNRYGRYQSYGAVEVMYPGGLAASGMSAPGWDWNKVPGTTTILLPFKDLMLPASISFLAEKNELNFSGGVKFKTPAPKSASDKILEDLHGDYGMFALQFKQPKVDKTTHNPSFIFRKSFFCFDDKIVCLGSNINNNNHSDKTITTLFQNSLASTSTPTMVDGATKTGVAQSENLNKTNAHWLIDAYKTGYYVLPGSTVHVERQSQTSPDHSGSGAITTANFANAYIDHGSAPSDDTYAYVIAPNTDAATMAQLASDMQSPSTRAFDILQQDNAAHIIRENASGVTGFSLFLPNTSLESNDILKANDVPCVAMMQVNVDTLRISLVNPDLKLVNNESTAVPITLTLYGKWVKIPNINSKYATILSSDPTQTTVQFSSADGLPAEITLLKINEVILPIVLLSFSGYSDVSGNQNVLNLKIENDNEAGDYYLERQTQDNGTWKTINNYNFPAAMGQQQYTFYDNDIVASVNNYRVKWREISGEWQYSKIVILKNHQQNSISVAPNPARDAFFIRLKQKPQRTANWLLANASGKIVKQGRLMNVYESISVKELSPGTYFFRLSSGETVSIIVMR